MADAEDQYQKGKQEAYAAEQRVVELVDEEEKVSKSVLPTVEELKNYDTMNRGRYRAAYKDDAVLAQIGEHIRKLNHLRRFKYVIECPPRWVVERLREEGFTVDTLLNDNAVVRWRTT